MMVELSDPGGRAAALTGTHDCTTTCAGAEPVLVGAAQEEPPAPNAPPAEELLKEEMEEENNPQTFVTLVEEEEGGVAGFEGSSISAAIGPSSESNFPGFRSEEAGPSVPTPMLNPQRLIQQGGNTTRQADANLDMVELSRVSIDVSRELQAIVGLSNIAALAARQ